MKIQIYSKTLTAIVLGASIFSVNGCVHYIDTPIVSEKTAETLKTESISKDNSASSEQMPDEETEERRRISPQYACLLMNCRPWIEPRPV